VEDDRSTAFPASAKTPGQRKSRTAYQRFSEQLDSYPWMEEYLELRQMELRGRKLDWRKAVYVAWASMPTPRRQPETQDELATQVLGLSSYRTISRWKKKYPELEELVAERQAAPLLKYRADVFEALGQVARMPDPKAHRDRKLFLEMSGDYSPRKAVEVTGEDGEAVQQVVAFDLSDIPTYILRRIANEDADTESTD
jgi:hypothetical protein